MPDQNRKEAHEKDSLGEYKGADDSNEEGKMPLEDFTLLLIKDVAAPEEGRGSFAAIQLNVDPKESLAPGKVGGFLPSVQTSVDNTLLETILSMKNDLDHQKSRIQNLELEAKKMEKKMEQNDKEMGQQKSRIQNLELEVMGRKFIQSVFEYIRFLEECTIRSIKKSNPDLLIRENRFGAIKRGSPAETALKSSPMYQRIDQVAPSSLVESLAQFRNQHSHEAMPLHEAQDWMRELESQTLNGPATTESDSNSQPKTELEEALLNAIQVLKNLSNDKAFTDTVRNKFNQVNKRK